MAVAHLFGQQVECRKRGIGSLHLSKLKHTQEPGARLWLIYLLA